MTFGRRCSARRCRLSFPPWPSPAPPVATCHRYRHQRSTFWPSRQRNRRRPKCSRTSPASPPPLQPHSRNSCRWGTPASPRLHSRDQFGCSQLQHHNLTVLGVPASLPQPSPAPWPHGGSPGCSSTSGVGCTATRFPASPPTRPLQRLYTLHPRQVCNCNDCW